MASNTSKLTKLAHKLGVRGEVIRSTCDAQGRYLLNTGKLPLTGLGWAFAEAKETLCRLAAERGQ